MDTDGLNWSSGGTQIFMDQHFFGTKFVRDKHFCGNHKYFQTIELVATKIFVYQKFFRLC